jgi:hypothetical protein
MDADLLSRNTGTRRVPKRTHNSASKLPAVLEGESECGGHHHVSFGRLKPSCSDEYILTVFDGFS